MNSSSLVVKNLLQGQYKPSLLPSERKEERTAFLNALDVKFNEINRVVVKQREIIHLQQMKFKELDGVIEEMRNLVSGLKRLREDDE